MKTRIIAFAGSKQAGKSTCSNFLHGYQLRANEIVQNFAITDTGKLIVNTNVLDEYGKEKITDTMLDTSRKDEKFVEWAMFNMWPFVKKYSFGDTLKEIAITLFDLTYEQVYGEEAYKTQQVPHLLWENMPGVITCPELWDHTHVDGELEHNLIYHASGPMTVREFLQFFGTEVMRKIYEPIWVQRCMKDIELEEPLLAIIDDCRFSNEIAAIQAAGGKVIGLTRKPYKDSHASEQVIENNADVFDAIIDNQNMTIQEMCSTVIDKIEEWGWLSEPKTSSKQSSLHTIKAKK